LGNLIFLVGAVGLSVVGSLLLWLRLRQPRSALASIDEFQREMSALNTERPTVVRTARPDMGTSRPVQGSTVHVRAPEPSGRGDTDTPSTPDGTGSGGGHPVSGRG